MAKLLFGVLALACTVAFVASTSVQFSHLIQMETEIYTLDNYANYGCHCGSNTKGAPMDETDKCCHKHACCYSKTQAIGCDPGAINYEIYLHKDHKTTCLKTNNKCDKVVCECDKEAAKCFRKNMPTYNARLLNKGSPPSCPGSTPSC